MYILYRINDNLAMRPKPHSKINKEGYYTLFLEVSVDTAEHSALVAHAHAFVTGLAG